MARNQTIVDGATGQASVVELTSDEETARDTEEAAMATLYAARDERNAEVDALKAKIADGSATYAELLEYTQYNIGAK